MMKSLQQGEIPLGRTEPIVSPRSRRGKSLDSSWICRRTPHKVKPRSLPHSPSYLHK